MTTSARLGILLYRRGDVVIAPYEGRAGESFVIDSCQVFDHFAGQD